MKIKEMKNKCDFVKDEANCVMLLSIQCKKAWRENFASLLNNMKQIFYSRKIQKKIALC